MDAVPQNARSYGRNAGGTPPASWTPYGEPGNGDTPPQAGDRAPRTGGAWFEYDSSYGISNTFQTTAEHAIGRHMAIQNYRTAHEYKGLADEQAVYYPIITPMLYLKNTGPEPVQVSDPYSGPIGAMQL